MTSEQLDDPRVRFAAERTLLAWIRTGLAMMGLGFVVARFGLFLRELAVLRGIASPSSPGVSVWMGCSLIFLGIAVNLIAASQHSTILGLIRRNEPYVPPQWSLGVAVSVVLALIGLAMTAYLIASMPR